MNQNEFTIRQNRTEQNRTEQNRTEQNRTEQNRDLTIQVIRAFCIAAVVLIHTCPTGLPQVFVRPFINFGVGSFIFLSGFLTREETWNKEKMWKRIRRVLYPYIIWTQIYSVRNPHRFLINLVTASSAAQMYYILVYMQLVLLTPFCFRIIKSKALTWCFMLLSPASFIINYYQTIGGAYVPNIVNTIYGISFIGWIWFYILGMKAQQQVRRWKILPLILIIVLSLLLQIGEGYIWYKAGDINCGTQIKLSSLITTTFSCFLWRELIFRHPYFEKIDKSVGQFLILIGNYSFGIYLSHIAIMMVFKKLPGYSNIPYVFNSCLVMLASLAFCIIGDNLLKKFSIGKTKLSQVTGLR